MDKKVLHPDILRLIRVSSFLWLGYLAVLAVISRIFQPLVFSNFLYYMFLDYVALVCLGLAYWPWVQTRLGRLFIPLVVFLTTVIPILINWSLAGNSPFSPLFSSSIGTLLGLLPFMLLALLLVAWQYKWQVTLAVVLGIAVLNFLVTLGIYGWSSPTSTTASSSGISLINSAMQGGIITVTARSVIQGALIITLIQTIIFLAIGFSITYLVGTLRKNQHSLEAANANLAHYASTLEHLSTSRERNRLARELHDTLAHTLSGLSVQLETAKAYWDVDPKEARALLENSSAIAHSGLEETRRALKALRASLLDDLGLAQAVAVMAKDAAAHGKLALRLAVADDLPTLSPDVEQGIYRITQEAIQNAVNHAAAGELRVSLGFAGGKTTLVVSDDGIGFDVDKKENQNHFGLAGMEERARLIGGELLITSGPGRGTTVKLTV